MNNKTRWLTAKRSGATVAFFVAVGSGGLLSCTGEGDGGGGYAAWEDPDTGLVWQDPTGDQQSWEEAVDYCDALEIDGQSGWQLPTIDEMRTIVNGCSATEPGGECQVTDSRNSSTDDWTEETCQHPCEWMEGPGEGGAYYVDGLHGSAGIAWSSTPDSSNDDWVWALAFTTGAIDTGETSGVNYMTRCVRD